MRKSEILKTLLSSPENWLIVRHLKRGELYQLTSMSGPKKGLYNDCIIKINHFYRDKIRFSVLTTTEPMRFSYLPTLRINIKKKKNKHRIKTRIVTARTFVRSLKYVNLHRYQFKKINSSDLPLYLDRATEEMEIYFKEKGNNA